MSWAEEVGRAILAAGVPWLPGMLSHGGMRVAVFMEANTMPHSADWPDLRDDATRGAVRGWLSDRAGYPVEFSIERLEALPVRYLYRPQSDRSLPDWREAEARALLALAREVLRLPCGHPASAVVASGCGPQTTNHCGACNTDRAQLAALGARDGD